MSEEPSVPFDRSPRARSWMIGTGASTPGGHGLPSRSHRSVSRLTHRAMTTQPWISGSVPPTIRLGSERHPTRLWTTYMRGSTMSLAPPSLVTLTASHGPSSHKTEQRAESPGGRTSVTPLGRADCERTSRISPILGRPAGPWRHRRAGSRRIIRRRLTGEPELVVALQESLGFELANDRCNFLRHPPQPSPHGPQGGDVVLRLLGFR